MKPSKPFKVYVSYASADRDLAGKLLDLLRTERNVRVWSDKQLPSGSDWAKEVRREITQSDLAVVLLTPEGMASKWAQTELHFALALDVPVLFVVTRRDYIDRLPYSVEGSPVLTVEEVTSPEGPDRFIDAVRERLAQPQPARA